MFILGINAYHGDVSAVLVRDGELVAAVEEERFRRIKHVAGFPTRGDPRLPRDGRHHGPRHRSRRASRAIRARTLRARRWFALRTARRPAACSATARRTTGRSARFPRRSPRRSASHRRARQPKMHWVEHHPAHLASTFFVSPFDDAAVCAIDGFGDFVSTSWAIGRGTPMDVIHRTFFPHSLGLLYLAITQYLGFMKYGDEFKVMGLAPYGAPDFVDEIRQLVHLLPGGALRARPVVLPALVGRRGHDVGRRRADSSSRVFSEKLEELLGPGAQADEPVTRAARSDRRVAAGASSRRRRSTCSTASTPRRRRRACVSPAAAR